MMKNFIRGGLVTAVLMTAMFLFVSCENLSVLMAQLDDDVKLANDRYLEVVETFPEQNDQNLNPKLQINVRLDRDVEPESMRQYIEISQKNLLEPQAKPIIFDRDSLELVFDSVSKELIIFPDPYLIGGDKITVSLLSGATALDGSVLRDPVAWSFYTANIPVGVIDIADGTEVNLNALEEFTNDPTPVISLEYSNTGEFFLTENESTASSIAVNATVWKPTDVKSGNEEVDSDASIKFSFDWGGDSPGWKTIYAVFKDPNSNALSFVESDTVYFDEDPPTGINGGANVSSFTNQGVTRTVTYSESGSGFQKALWSSVPGVLFSPSVGETTTMTGPSGQYIENMPVEVRVYDKAGNLSTDYDTIYINWDNQPPGRPNITTTSSTLTGNPSLSWSWTSGSLYNGDINGGYMRRLGTTLYGGKTSWSTWTSDTSPYSYTASTSLKPKAVGWYYYDLQVQQFDGLGNASTIDISDRTYFQSVRPFYGGTTNYLGKTILTAVMTLDWPGYPPGLSSLQDYKAQYRKVGSKIWKSATVAGRDGSSATVPIGADDTNRAGNYEWQYQIVTGKTVNYTSPTFYFTVTNS